jgi:hypothetical protein
MMVSPGGTVSKLATEASSDTNLISLSDGKCLRIISSIKALLFYIFTNPKIQDIPSQKK